MTQKETAGAGQATRSTRGRGRPVNPQEREAKRQILLDAALRMFCDKGYFQVTVDEIARSSGQSKGTFYWHFDSKDDCLEQVIDRGVRELNEGIDLIEKTYTTPQEQLFHMTDVTPWMKTGFQQFMRLLNGLNDAGEHRLRAHARERSLAALAECRRRVGAMFSRIVADSGQAGFDPDILAACFIATFDGLLSHARLAPNYVDPQAVTETLRLLFYRRFYSD